MAPSTRPWIGINSDFIPAGKHGIAQSRVNAGYFDAVLSAGGLPIILPPLAKGREIDAFLDRLDGMVLTGGLDLDPCRLGQPSHASIQPMAHRREENDRLLVQRIVAREVPVLAIGVGMQMLNQVCGGSLYLHIPEDLPRALPHKDSSDGPHRHLVLIEPDTRLDEIYGGGEMRVNSDHHQSVRLVGAGLRVAARAPDGVIEAIEATDPNWFCVGVQWHPESGTATALDLQLFESFIQACLRHTQSLHLAA